MARMLIVSTHGSEDPTRAGVAFVMAKGAVEAGHKPEICLRETQRCWREGLLLKAWCR